MQYIILLNLKKLKANRLEVDQGNKNEKLKEFFRIMQ